MVGSLCALGVWVKHDVVDAMLGRLPACNRPHPTLIPEHHGYTQRQTKRFYFALIRVFKIKEHGILWNAIECKTLSWIGRSQTGRSVAMPGGDVAKDKVIGANVMVGIMTLFMLIAWLRGVDVAMENPKNSILGQVEPMRTFLHFVTGAWKHTATTYMGAYGGDSQKPLWL